MNYDEIIMRDLGPQYSDFKECHYYLIDDESDNDIMWVIIHDNEDDREPLDIVKMYKTPR